MSQDSELRSIHSGRPAGTFGEAADRMRAWCWLSEVFKVSGVDDVTELDRHKPRHLLSENLHVARRFESVLLDGYNPATVQAKSKTHSLLKQVSEASGRYASAEALHGHEFWKHLKARISPMRRDDVWIRQQLLRHGLLKLDPVDESHAYDLGLLPGDDYEGRQGEQDEDGPVPAHLDLDGTRFATLDGLQLLLLLYREAQDLANVWYATQLGKALQAAASEFASDKRWHGEALDTWHHLVRTRMLTWDPEFVPSKASLDQAEKELLSEREAAPRRRGKRGQSHPSTYTHGRSERRWRRQIWARACQLQANTSDDSPYRTPPKRQYVIAELGEWLVENRELIGKHVERAVDTLMDVDELFTGEARKPEPLPPLVMPESLHRRRVRPPMDEETWQHFGDSLPFDLIPVKVKAST